MKIIPINLYTSLNNSIHSYKPCQETTGLFIEQLPPMVPDPEYYKQYMIPSFGYKSLLKTYFLQGKLPTVTRDFYGSKLTKENCTLEHIIPHSKHNGKNIISNFALAAGKNNWSRGNKPLSTVFNLKAFNDYCAQFEGIKLPYFDGDTYIEGITRTVEKALKNGY